MLADRAPQDSQLCVYVVLMNCPYLYLADELQFHRAVSTKGLELTDCPYLMGWLAEARTEPSAMETPEEVLLSSSIGQPSSSIGKPSHGGAGDGLGV